jgi:hypothetical protein
MAAYSDSAAYRLSSVQLKFVEFSFFHDSIINLRVNFDAEVVQLMRRNFKNLSPQIKRTKIMTVHFSEESFFSATSKFCIFNLL